MRPSTMRHLGTVSMMVAAVLLTGCGTGPSDSAKGGTVNQPGTSPSAASELRITVRSDQNVAPQTWTLRCDPPGGDHPDAAAACAAIAKAERPFAATAKDQICTQIYGGPQTATIEGTWKGQPVKATYSRTDGCEIARWKKLEAVFHISPTVPPS
jgi:hypothetical protein